MGFAISRFFTFPKKTLPFIIIGLTGSIGFSIWNSRLKNEKLKNIDSLKNEINNKKSRLDLNKKELDDLSQKMESRKKEYEKKDLHIVSLIAIRDEADRKLKKAEESLDQEIKNYIETVKQSVSQKKKKIAKIETDADKIDSLSLLEELLKEARS